MTLHSPQNSTRRDAPRNPYGSADRRTGTIVAGVPTTKEAAWDTKRLRNYGTGIDEILKASTTANGGRLLNDGLVKRLTKMGEHLSRARVLMSRGQYPSDEMMENIYLTVDQLDQEQKCCCDICWYDDSDTDTEPYFG